MSAVFEFEAQERSDHGRTAARRLRRLEDKVPAVIYGAGKPAKSIALLHNRVMQALEHEAVYSHILTINVDKTPEKVVLKDMMRHPTKPKVLHIDFLRVDMSQKLTMRIPLHFEGEEAAPGVKDGGVFSHLMTELEISCLPADLPEYIVVDVSQMALGDSIHMSHIVLPKGVALGHAIVDEEHDHSIVSLHVPKIVVEEEEVAAAPVETVILTEAKAEEEPAAAATDKKKPAEK